MLPFGELLGFLELVAGIRRASRAALFDRLLATT